MLGYINGIDFLNLDAMKYYAPPASWSDAKKHDNAKNKIFSNDWYGAEKKDGFFTMALKDEDGNCFIRSRSRGVNGEYANKVEWVPQLNEFFGELSNGTCLLGELYLPSTPGSKNVTTILGCLKEKALSRQNSGEQLHFYVFDVLALNNNSMIATPALTRFLSIQKLCKREYSCVEFARYYNGDGLWHLLSTVFNDGGEGIVITKSTAKYEPGKRPSTTTLKVKRELQETIDCFIFGANAPTKEYSGKDIENWPYYIDSVTGERLEIKSHYREYSDGYPIEPVTKPYYFKWAGSLKLGLMKDSKVVHFGDLSGVTDEVKENWRDYVGKVIEVNAMEIFKDGDARSLRHPRLIQWRDDKTPKDCDWSQVV